jgi:outer membrane receptor protein involved in Fe transport
MRTARSLWLGGVALGVLTGSAAAQPGDSSDAAAMSGGKKQTEQIEQILVTANKRRERVVDVAASVTALGSASLSARRLTRIEDIVAQVPGLSIQGSSNGGVTLVLRGLNTGGSGATVSTLIDDIPLTYSTSNASGNQDTPNIDTFDLARVEVLRGPHGTLYGASAEGGLLKYVYNDPSTAAYSGKLESEVNGVDGGGTGYALHGMVNAPLSPNFAVRAVAYYNAEPGYIDNALAHQNDINAGQRYGFRVSALWTPSDDIDFRLSAMRQLEHYDGSTEVEVNGVPSGNPASATEQQFDIANGGQLERNAYTSEPSTRSFALYDLHAHYAGDFFDLTSITGYGENKATYLTDDTDFPIAPGFTFGDLASAVYGAPATVIARQQNSLQKWAQELRLASLPDLHIGRFPVQLQAGFFYTHEDVDYGQAGLSSYVGSPTVIINSPALGSYRLPGTYNEYSGFADATIHLLPSLQVEGGVRYTADTVTTQTIYYQGLRYPTPNASFAFPAIGVSDHPVTWSVAVKYAVNDRLNVYTRIASGFRPGGSNIPFLGQTVQNPNYQSDSTVNYEVGFKGGLLDDRISLDVAAFYVDWSRVQIQTAINSASGLLIYTGNAGSATSKGLEWNTAWRPLRGLTISDSGAYTNATLDTDAPALGGAKGDQLPYVPPLTNTLNVDYAWPVSDSTQATLRGGWSYLEHRNGGFLVAPPILNKPDLPSYHTLSAAAELHRGGYWAQLYGQNLTNARGIINYTSTSGHDGTGLATIIQPLTIGLRIGTSF